MSHIHNSKYQLTKFWHYVAHIPRVTSALQSSLATKEMKIAKFIISTIHLHDSLRGHQSQYVVLAHVDSQTQFLNGLPKIWS